MLWALTLKQLATSGRKVLPQIQDYVDINDKMAGFRNQLMVETGEIANKVRDWVKNNRQAADRLFTLMHDATIAGTDPMENYAGLNVATLKKQIDGLSKTEASRIANVDAIANIQQMINYETSGQRKAAYDKMRKALALIPQSGRDVYVMMRDHYKSRALLTHTEIVKRIDRSEMDADTKKQTIMKLRAQFENASKIAPYFPLSRFGDYWVVGKDAEGKKDFRLYENEAEAKSAHKAMLDNGYTDVKQGVKLDSNSMCWGK